MTRREVILCSIPVSIIAFVAWDIWRHNATTIDIEESEPFAIITKYDDHWGAGSFGYEPSRIRRVHEKYPIKGERMESITYFARLSFSKFEFEKEFAKWKADPKFAFHQDFKPPEPLPSFWPSWFPLPSAENYLGNLYYPREFQAYQPKGSSDVYLYTAPQKF